MNAPASDAVPDGQTPHTVSLCLYDELVDLVKPGDRISLTGIFRSIPVRLNPRQRVIKSLFKTYLDVVHIKKTDAKRMGVDASTRQGDDRRGVVGVGGEEGGEGDDADMDIDGDAAQREESAQAKIKDKMVEISQRDDIYEYLARSLAPSIWEMDDVKKGILLQLFGGTNKHMTKGGGGGGPRYRGDINVLMVGDPGTSKSQILHVSLFSHPLFTEWKMLNLLFPLVCPQNCSSRCLHVWKGIFSCRIDCLRYARSRFETTRS